MGLLGKGSEQAGGAGTLGWASKPFRSSVLHNRKAGHQLRVRMEKRPRPQKVGNDQQSGEGTRK